MNPFNGGWVILVSVIIALVLTVFRLPEGTAEWLAWLRPGWVMLVLFFWVMELPHRIGLITAWLIGLLMDGLLGEPMGLNGFLLAGFTFVTWRFFERLRMYSIAQQGGVLFVLVAAAELVRAAAMNLVNDQPVSFSLFGSALTSMLLWPLMYLVLMRIRIAVRVE